MYPLPQFSAIPTLLFRLNCKRNFSGLKIYFYGAVLNVTIMLHISIQVITVMRQIYIYFNTT